MSACATERVECIRKVEPLPQPVRCKTICETPVTSGVVKQDCPDIGDYKWGHHGGYNRGYNRGGGFGWGWLWFLLLFIVVLVVVWIALIFLKPLFLQILDLNGVANGCISHGKAFATAFLIALFIVFIAWIIRCSAVWGQNNY